jgi:NADH-quinone oxidoreductase subunit C
MGIAFLGHPDLRRILMYPEFVGHPLRKDYPADKAQPLVPFREGYEKLLPFDRFEGMSFGRQVFRTGKAD